jgi:hypothetical protein
MAFAPAMGCWVLKSMKVPMTSPVPDWATVLAATISIHTIIKFFMSMFS